MRSKIFVLALLSLAIWSKAWGQASPLYVVDLRAATPQEQLTTVSLQGLLNRDSPAVFTLSNAQDEAWLAWDLQLQPRSRENLSPAQLLEKFSSRAKGQVLYDAGDPLSLNLATSLAGLKDGVITDRDLGLPTIADLRGKFKTTLAAYQWAEKELFPGVSPSAAAFLGSGSAVRDYLIAHRLLALPLPASGDREAWTFLGKNLGFLASGATVFSPAPERTPALLANWANHFGYNLTGGAAAANLSFHSKFSGTTFRPRGPYAELQGQIKIYVCFIFSGGDDLSNALERTRQVWQDPARPGLSLGWTLSPTLAKVAPDVLQAYAGEAYRSNNDSFLLQVDRISSLGEKALATLTQAQTALGTSALVVTEAAAGDSLLPVVKRLATTTQASGIFLPNLPGIAPQLVGNTVITNIGFAAARPEEILPRLKALPEGKGGLLFVLVNEQTTTPTDLANIISQLPDTFEVVGPEEFSLIARQVLAKRQQETAAENSSFTLQAPDNITPEAALTVRGTLGQPASGPVLLLYRQGDGAEYYREMSRQNDGTYQVTLPPLLRGGDWLLQARADLANNQVAWSPEITVQVAVQDEDNDNLDLPEETLFATDPNQPDSDGDGLLDGYDANPLQADSSQELYFGPLLPGEDTPYLLTSANTSQAGGRVVGPGESLVYRLPTTGLPPGAPVVLGLQLQGGAEVAFSADGQQFSTPSPPSPGKLWDTVPLPQDLLTKKAFYCRLAPVSDGAEIKLKALALFSPPAAPSFAQAAIIPTYPGPGTPFGVAANIWDPQGIKTAWGVYRAGGGLIKVALQQVGNSPIWRGALGAIDSSGPLEWWLVAENHTGATAASRRHYQWCGTFSAETLSLSPSQELTGAWDWAATGWGAARSAAVAGLRDQGEFSASGGTYTVWALTGGDRELAIWLDGSYFQRNSIKGEGWQNLGEIKLSAGAHALEVVAGAGDEGSRAHYGQILLTTAKAFSPPPYGLLVTANSVRVFTPGNQETIGPRTEVKATATGNISRADFYVDGKLIKRLPAPPYDFIWDSGRLPEGRHVLQMMGLDRAGQILSTLAIEVEFSRKQPK